MGFFCLPSVFSHSCFLVGCLDCLEVEAWQVGPMGTSGGEASPCTQWVGPSFVLAPVEETPSGTGSGEVADSLPGR